jgi:hypothetical protein
MSVIGTALKSLVALLGFLVVADIVGVVVGTILDILPLRGVSGLLFYVIWLVLGIFCGLFAYNAAGAWATPKAGEKVDTEDWTGLPDARRIGSVILVVGILTIAALTAFFHNLYWSRGVSGEYFVPDSMSHSIVFFLSALAGIVLARTALMPARTSQGLGSLDARGRGRGPKL